MPFPSNPRPCTSVSESVGAMHRGTMAGCGYGGGSGGGGLDWDDGSTKEGCGYGGSGGLHWDDDELYG